MIGRLASKQHGVVARRQLRALGVTGRAIDRAVAAGRLSALHAGVYAVGHEALPPRAQEMAAVLACGRGAVISHRSAAALWSLPHGRSTKQVEVCVPRDWAPRRPGIRIYRTRSLAPDEVRRLGRLPVTSPARTLFDLAGQLSEELLELAVAEAQTRRLLRRRELDDQLARNSPQRGAARLRELVEVDADPALTRSAAERKMLRLLRASSIPSPVVNAQVGRYEVDFLWPRERLIVEVDGFAFHSSRHAFERDRIRDAELQTLGYRVMRVTWRQLQRQPRAVVARIARALAR